MALDLTYFTVEADYLAVIGDTNDDADHDPDTAPITGTVTFTPLVNTGDLIMATQAMPRPTGLALLPIVGVIDVDGRLKLRDVADDGVEEFAPIRLVADTPFLELENPLFYRVAFTGVKFAGRSGTIAPFTFQAPNSDTVINLIGVGRQPGQPASGITKVAPGGVRVDDDGNIVFTFGGVDIPEPLNFGIGPTLGGGNGGGGGVAGPPGADGKDGSQWFFGVGEPVVALPGSSPGDVYLDTDTGTIYRLGDSYIK